MRGTYTIGKRLLAILLCICMVAAYMPKMALFTTAVGADLRIADESTMNDWEGLFLDPDTQGVALTTEYAGGVWTDKSVFLPDSIPDELKEAVSTENTHLSIANTDDNFLVALSAIASNKEIVGYSTIPTDTVFVLDLSSSMRSTDDDRKSAVDELIEATNKAITELLALNRNNRVAVIVYAGNTNKSFSEGQGNVSIVMPLDSYTTNQTAGGVGTYLQADPLTVREGRNEVPNTNPHGLAVYDGVSSTTGAGNAFRNNSFESATGTFMQDGIYEAMKLLNAAAPIVEEGIQAGTTRLPIMVLMTDGESTLGNPDYNGNDARTDLGASSMYDYEGSTGTYSHRDTLSFVTSLTAAFAKKQIANHYGTNPLFYTLPYGTAVLNRSEALSVLNPAAASTTQNRLWNAFLNGEQLQVYRYRSGNQNRYLTVQNSAAASERLTAEDRMYVDEYFPAENDEAMHQAFEAIVEEIIIQSKYYPTYVEKDHDHDGYITFTDKIGGYMDIKSIKGFVIGDHYFSGATLSRGFVVDDSIFGTIDNPNVLGDNLVWSVKERLGIESTTVARALLQAAFDHGQLSYTSDTQFSNYIGWYSDADGNYLDFWHEGADLNDKPSGATHIVKSYGFLGQTDEVHGISDTDMLYASVRVSKELTDFDGDGITGETMLLWQVPASLIPTITYEVEVTVDSQGEITGVESVELENTDVKPIRLLYEIGLQEGIHDWNVAEKVSSGYVESTANKDEGYVFYTNQWKKGNTAEDAANTERNTYSHFEPSVENERYYYTENTPLYTDQNGTEYTSSAKPDANGTYYRTFRVYEKMTNGTYRMHTHYERISSAALRDAVQVNGQWYIPKGEIHRYLDDLRVSKTGNETGGNTHTMGYSNYPTVVPVDDDYYSYSTLGNNGKLLYTPATGIKLTKALAAGYTTNESFTFTISGGDLSNAQVVRLDDHGGEASRTGLAANGEVTLAAGETVYIIGLAADTYTVSENTAGKDYKVSLVTVDNAEVTGTQAVVNLTAQDITDVEFTNDRKGYGSLIVSKDVNYPEGFVPGNAHDAMLFEITVTFTGTITGIVAPQGAVQNNNSFTLNLKDGESVTFSNIPEGVTYEVAEGQLSAGYGYVRTDYSDSTGTIDSQDTDTVGVVNEYTPSPADPNVIVTGTKTVQTNNNDPWPNGAEFTVRLYETTSFAGGNFTQLAQAQLTAGNPTYSFNLKELGVDLDKVGTYYFRVVEDIPAENDPDRIENMAYDRSIGLFTVTVTDTDADGVLEIFDVNGFQDTGAEQTTDGWAVTKNFINVMAQDRVYLDLQKIIQDAQGAVISDALLADFTFTLFTDEAGTNRTEYFSITDAAGKATIMIPVTANQEAVTYYLREVAPAVENRVPGMHYDESVILAVEISWDGTANQAVVRTWKIGETPATSERENDTIHVEVQHINTYKDVQASVTLSGTKELTGRDFKDSDAFSFQLYNATAAFVPQGNALQTVAMNGGSFAFAPVPFTQPGIYYMVAKEVIPAEEDRIPGVTYDASEYHITVEIEKYENEETGFTELRVKGGAPHIVKYGTTTPVNGDQLHFTNDYTITGDTSVTITGTKTLTGRPMINGEFQFTLTEVANAKGEALTDGLVLQAVNGPATDHTADIRFGPITYTEVGTHYYKISEVKGAENIGITYSSASYIVRVDVTDNTQGGLNSAWVIVDENDAVVSGASIGFTNTYTPDDISLQLTGLKDLEGRELSDYIFDFSIVETDSTYEPLTGAVPQIVHNNSNGIIIFPAWTYTADDAGEDFYYLVEEVTGNAGGIHYDTAKFYVHVKITDNGQGSLESQVEIEKVVTDDSVDPAEVLQFPVSSIAFNNHYVITGGAQVVLEGNKTLTGRPTELQADEFTFELYVDETDYVTTGTPVTAQNAADGKISLPLNYGPDDAGKTYYYVLKEQKGDTTYITYSDTEYRFQVRVEDDGNGKLIPAVTVSNANVQVTVEDTRATVTGLNFLNTYTPKPVTYTPQVQKEYKGDAMKTFSFVLSGTGFETQVKENDETGKAVFDTLTFQQAGTYAFTVREQQNALWGFIRFDTNVYTLTVTVVDNGKGALEIKDIAVTSLLGSTDLTFRNVHEDLIVHKDVSLASDPTVSMDGKPVKNGDELVYTLSYTNHTGKTVEQVVFTDTISQYLAYVDGSADKGGVFADGTVTWKIGYVKPGETVTVSFRAKVTGTAAVTNTATVADGENTYTSNQVINPVTPSVPATPQTGDEMNLVLWLSALAVSAAAMAVLLTNRKRIFK